MLSLRMFICDLLYLYAKFFALTVITCTRGFAESIRIGVNLMMIGIKESDTGLAAPSQWDLCF